jgi:hypothetical protein
MRSIKLRLLRDKNLSFFLPVPFPYRDFFINGKEKHGDWYDVEISYPRKPRTTGDKSQNHRIAFLCNIIAAENAFEGFTTYQSVKDLAKLRAIKRGYPYRWAKVPGYADAVLPCHENELDTVQAGYLIDELEQMAAECGIDTNSV